MVYQASPKRQSEVRFLHRPPSLFFRLFVLRALPAPVAELRKFYLALYFFLVFLAPIIHSFTCRTREFYKSVLTHDFLRLSYNKKPRKLSFAKFLDINPFYKRVQARDGFVPRTVGEKRDSFCRCE